MQWTDKQPHTTGTSENGPLAVVHDPRNVSRAPPFSRVPRTVRRYGSVDPSQKNPGGPPLQGASREARAIRRFVTSKNTRGDGGLSLDDPKRRIHFSAMAEIDASPVRCTSPNDEPRSTPRDSCRCGRRCLRAFTSPGASRRRGEKDRKRGGTGVSLEGAGKGWEESPCASYPCTMQRSSLSRKGGQGMQGPDCTRDGPFAVEEIQTTPSHSRHLGKCTNEAKRRVGPNVCATSSSLISMEHLQNTQTI